MVYDNVKDLCEEKGLSIYELEVKSGLANATIGKWRKSTPTLDSLRKVAAVLQVSIEKLIEEKDTEN
jgi:transcriptional regulator with XRE-family HTH domain